VDEIIFETGQRKQRLTKAVLADHETSTADEDGTETGASVSCCSLPPPAVPNSDSLPLYLQAGNGGGSEINKMLRAALQNYIKR
jgi:hypothetical protein